MDIKEEQTIININSYYLLCYKGYVKCLMKIPYLILTSTLVEAWSQSKSQS